MTIVLKKLVFDVRKCFLPQKDFVPMTVSPPTGVVLEKQVGGWTDQVVVVKITMSKIVRF